MLRTVLWISLACAVLLAALALTRGARFTAEPARERPAVEAPAAEDAGRPVAAQAPEPTLPTPPRPSEPDIDLQTREDAAATGMTTVEPEPPPVQELPPPARPPHQP